MKNILRHLWFAGLVILMLFFLAGCGAVRETEIVQAPSSYMQAKTATTEEIIELVNTSYAGIDSISVSRFNVEFTGGSLEDGYFEKYRQANGYLVAMRPDSIFVNILNPLTKSSVLTMASSEKNFQIWIPSKNQFVTGPTDIDREEENPVYNARPSHFIQGIMMESVDLNDPELNFYIEEEDNGVFRYYVLVILGRDAELSKLSLLRKIWIERSAMQVRRQRYFIDSRVVSDITYGPAVEVAGRLVPTTVKIERPLERYAIDFEIETESVRLNRELQAGVFQVPMPRGAELIRIEDEEPEADN